MFAFLKSKRFDTAFSFILGLGLMSLLKPICKGDECNVRKAPPYEEVKTSTYQLGGKCYKFEVQHKDCPLEGMIEPFERFVR